MIWAGSLARRRCVRRPGGGGGARRAMRRSLYPRRLPDKSTLSDEMLTHIAEDVTLLRVAVQAQRDGWSEAA